MDKWKEFCIPGIDVSFEAPDHWKTSPFSPSQLTIPLQYEVLNESGQLAYGAVARWTGWCVTKTGEYDAKDGLNSTFRNSEMLDGRKCKLINVSDFKVEGAELAELAVYKSRIHKKGFKKLKYKEVEMFKAEQYEDKTAFRMISVGYCYIGKKYDEIFNKFLNSLSCSTESGLGICFDMSQMETNYGEQALECFINSTEPNIMEDSEIYSGDIQEDKEVYCLSISTPYPKTCQHIRDQFGEDFQYPGIAPHEKRFLNGVKLFSHESSMVKKGSFHSSKFIRI